MPELTTIWFWPSGGRLIDPEEDAFVRTAGRIGELYSDAAARRHLPARSSQLRWFAQHTPGAQAVEVHVHPDAPIDGFDFASVVLPDGVAQLAAEERAALVVEVIDTGLTRLHTARGWAFADIASIRAEVEASGGVFVRTGDWKSSPGRTWQARAVYRLGDDGDGWAHIEAVSRRAGDTRRWISDPARNASSFEGFRRRTRLRWSGRDTVELVAGPVGVKVSSSKVTLDLSRASPTTTSPVTPPPIPPLRRNGGWPVTALVHGGDHTVSRPEARLGGGGPMNDVPEAYAEASYLISDWVEQNLMGWWTRGPANLWENLWDFCPSRTTKPYVRLTGHRLTTRIRHPMPDPAAEADPVGHARTDMLDLLAAVRKRLGLPALPIEPPSADTIATAVDAAIAHQRSFNNELIALIESLADRLPKWLVRDLIDDVHSGVSGDALGALHFQLTERGITLTPDERQTWHRLSHHDELRLDDLGLR